MQKFYYCQVKSSVNNNREYFRNRLDAVYDVTVMYSGARDKQRNHVDAPSMFGQLIKFMLCFLVSVGWKLKIHDQVLMKTFIGCFQ